VFALETAHAAHLAATDLAHPVPLAVGCRALGDNSFSSRLISRMASASPPLFCIFTFSSGDPVASAFQLAAEAARLSNATGCALQQPASWSSSLLPPIDQSIFG
jgi:hypothetical protein